MLARLGRKPPARASWPGAGGVQSVDAAPGRASPDSPVPSRSTACSLKAADSPSNSLNKKEELP